MLANMIFAMPKNVIISNVQLLYDSELYSAEHIKINVMKVFFNVSVTPPSSHSFCFSFLLTND